MLTLIAITVLFFAFLFFAVFAPDRSRGPIEKVFDFAGNVVFDSVNFLSDRLNSLTIILHFIGRLATLVLLASSLAVFANEAIVTLGFESFFSGARYDAWLQLFRQPNTWAAATTIVATTVAISNFRKLDIDFVDYVEKQRERREKRNQEEKDRKEAARTSLRMGMPRDPS